MKTFDKLKKLISENEQDIKILCYTGTTYTFEAILNGNYYFSAHTENTLYKLTEQMINNSYTIVEPKFVVSIGDVWQTQGCPTLTYTVVAFNSDFTYMAVEDDSCSSNLSWFKIDFFKNIGCKLIGQNRISFKPTSVEVR